MTASIVTWQPGTAPLGPAVVAIGVFDGVHLGHQALLRDAVADALARGVQSVAVTFDRDPDQIVSPESAAPQLLTLSDKLSAMSRTGLDAILVVPFTARLAELAPESFLDSVLLEALTPVAVHVGSDFRFGTMATGDVSTLQRIGAIRGFDVAPHDLLTVDGQAITSTRIRSLVAEGNITEATRLLGGHPCVSGTVHRGRGEGAALGFPTANVVPVEFAALPGSGVYAGRAARADGSSWASAISVGTPPMFPEAKDYLEAHLVDFDGDLYDQPLTLEFWDRLRDQQTYPTLEALEAAISVDVSRTLDIAGFTDEELAASAAPDDTVQDDVIEIGDDHFDLDMPKPVFAEQATAWAIGKLAGSLGEPTSDVEDDCVSDPAALEAAEQAAMRAPDSFTRMATGEWVALTSRQFSALAGGLEAFSFVAPLNAENIPYCWDPYPPQDAPGGLRGAMTRDFTLMVPQAERARAQEALASAAAGDSAAELPADDDSFVDDPAGLEAAEQAAQNYREPELDPTTAPEDWILILDNMRFDKQRFVAIDGALESAGIEHVWEPYPPEQAPMVRISFFDTERFGVSVPESEVASAKGLLASLLELGEG